MSVHSSTICFWSFRIWSYTTIFRGNWGKPHKSVGKTNLRFKIRTRDLLNTTSRQQFAKVIRLQVKVGELRSLGNGCTWRSVGNVEKAETWIYYENCRLRSPVGNTKKLLSCNLKMAPQMFSAFDQNPPPMWAIPIICYNYCSCAAIVFDLVQEQL